MLTHLPGQTSLPSRKGVTSNILILRCSFHKTAKRLSITSLTHLPRLRPKIQSSIVRHNKHVTTWLQLYRNVILLQTKQEKKYEVSQTTLNCQCDWQIFALFQNGDTKKITDWITSQKPIYRRHPINLNNNITDISQKKRSAYKR